MVVYLSCQWSAHYLLPHCSPETYAIILCIKHLKPPIIYSTSLANWNGFHSSCNLKGWKMKPTLKCEKGAVPEEATRGIPIDFSHEISPCSSPSKITKSHLDFVKDKNQGCCLIAWQLCLHRLCHASTNSSHWSGPLFVIFLCVGTFWSSYLTNDMCSCEVEPI